MSNSAQSPGSQDRKMMSRLEPHKNRLKLGSILVVSDLDDKGMLQKPRTLLHADENTHLIPGVGEAEGRSRGKERVIEGPVK